MNAISRLISELDTDFKQPIPPTNIEFSLNSEIWRDFLTQHHEWLIVRSYIVNNIIYGNIDNHLCNELVEFASTNNGRRKLAVDILESGIFKGIPRYISKNTPQPVH